MKVLFILLYTIYFIYSSSIITFPFKRIFNDEIITNDTFYKNYYDNNIFTTIDIGTPNTEINLQIKLRQYSLCVRNTTYDYNNSLTYKSNEEKDINVYNKDFKCSQKSNETFILGKEKVKIKDINFMLTKVSKYRAEGLLGLQIFDNEEKVWGYSLIPQLKKKNLIKKESFFFIFDKNSDNGELIIGDYPHLIEKYKNNFYEEQFQITCIFLPNYDQNFDLKFRRVSWNGTEFETLTVGYIEIEFGLIIGTLKFCDISWNFFAPHFIKGKCTQVEIDILYQSYVCDDYEDFDITKFPSIKFYISDADLNLELTYEDVFVKKNGKVYFMICFHKKGLNVYWHLGNIFLKRNMLVFDIDRKIIGFYNQNKALPIASSKIYYLIIIVIIAIIVIIGLIAFIIIKFFYGKRRKKAYELDEDYEYKTNKIIND